MTAAYQPSGSQSSSAGAWQTHPYQSLLTPGALEGSRQHDDHRVHGVLVMLLAERVLESSPSSYQALDLTTSGMVAPPALSQ